MPFVYCVFVLCQATTSNIAILSQRNTIFPTFLVNIDASTVLLDIAAFILIELLYNCIQLIKSTVGKTTVFELLQLLICTMG